MSTPRDEEDGGRRRRLHLDDVLDLLCVAAKQLSHVGGDRHAEESELAQPDCKLPCGHVRRVPLREELEARVDAFARQTRAPIVVPTPYETDAPCDAWGNGRLEGGGSMRR